MGHFSHGGASGRAEHGGKPFGRPSFPRPSFGGRDNRGGSTELFSTVCADCGNKCEVPFKPNGTKPVYCRECFGNKGGRDAGTFTKKDWSDHRAQKPSFEQSNRAPENYKKEFEILHSKIDKLTYMVEQHSKAKSSEPKAEKTPEFVIGEPAFAKSFGAARKKAPAKAKAAVAAKKVETKKPVSKKGRK